MVIFINYLYLSVDLCDSGELQQATVLGEPLPHQFLMVKFGERSSPASGHNTSKKPIHEKNGIQLREFQDTDCSEEEWFKRPKVDSGFKNRHTRGTGRLWNLQLQQVLNIAQTSTGLNVKPHSKTQFTPVAQMQHAWLSTKKMTRPSKRYTIWTDKASIRTKPRCEFIRREFYITMIRMLRILMEKPDSMKNWLVI